MAVTQGHGNPKWTRDEIILALDLYFDCEDQIPSSHDSRVRELSELLRSFPYHAQAARKESFRNPDGVAFKLQNLRQLATGKGLGNTSKRDRQIWEEFGEYRSKTKEFANLIRSGIKVMEGVKEDFSDYEVFAEGKVVTQSHLKRERAPDIRRKLLIKRKSEGGLSCDLCDCGPSSSDPELSESIFEAHHIIPLAVGSERLTKLKEMALLCASCHRLIHKAISLKKQWLSIAEARAFLRCQENA